MDTTLGYQDTTGAQPALTAYLDGIGEDEFVGYFEIDPLETRWVPQVGDVVSQGEVSTEVIRIESALVFIVADPAGFITDPITITRPHVRREALGFDGRFELADNPVLKCTDLLVGSSKIVSVQLDADAGAAWQPSLDADVLLVTLTADVEISELVPGWRRQVLIVNATGPTDRFVLTIKHDTYGNEEYAFFGCVGYGGEGPSFGDVLLRTDDMAMAVYDAAIQRWRVMQVSERALTLADFFPGLYAGWQGSAGKTLAGSDVTSWTSNAGSASPLVLASQYPQHITSGADYVQLNYDGGFDLPSCSVNIYPATILATPGDDMYLAICAKVPLADDTVTQVALQLYGDGATISLGYLYGSAFAMLNPTGAGDLTDPSVVAQQPVAIDDVFVVEMWSDGADINARINGGSVESLAWVGSKWPALFNSITLNISSNIGFPAAGRDHEHLIVLGAYPGDEACQAWRASCAQYGYVGA